jgi:hypothetical protein
MTQRKAKKQPARGARKPSRNGHDPLSGPEEAAAAARAEAESAAPSELKPFKIIGQLIGARYNAEGEIIGEEVMGEVAIYRSNFSKVEELVDQAVEQARSAVA